MTKNPQINAVDQKTEMRKSRRALLRRTGIAAIVTVPTVAMALTTQPGMAHAAGLKVAMWARGYTAIPQRTGPEVFDRINDIPWSDVHGLPTGSGRSFSGKAGTDNWFHVDVPTPIIVDDVRLSLERILVLFSTQHSGVYIDTVHCYDGTVPFWSGGGRISGDYSQSAVLERNMWLPRDQSGLHTLLWPLGISVHVTFESAGMITFTMAGADFWT